jgi:diguanylate cyclase (GGDEF)-like protein
MAKKRILVADDDPDILDVMKITLGDEYDIIEASNGQEALEKTKKSMPDLLLLDHQMPKMTGRQVCVILKNDVLLRHLSIIMVTGKGELEDKVKGIESGADDYIVKPFEPEELLARVRMVMRRTEMDLDANPLTRLPGNVSIYRAIEGKIASGEQFAACYIDLDRFKAFNDKYGFEKGDEAIRETARILLEAIQECGSDRDFVGHIGGDDYVILIGIDKITPLCEWIIKEFDRRIKFFFSSEDRVRGAFVVKNRKGETEEVPLISVSISAVTNTHHKLAHVAQVGEIAAQLKSYAKSLPGSNYVIDKRKE